MFLYNQHYIPSSFCKYLFFSNNAAPVLMKNHTEFPYRLIIWFLDFETGIFVDFFGMILSNFLMYSAFELSEIITKGSVYNEKWQF